MQKTSFQIYAAQKSFQLSILIRILFRSVSYAKTSISHLCSTEIIPLKFIKDHYRFQITISRHRGTSLDVHVLFENQRQLDSLKNQAFSQLHYLRALSFSSSASRCFRSAIILFCTFCSLLIGCCPPALV